MNYEKIYYHLDTLLDLHICLVPNRVPIKSCHPIIDSAIIYYSDEAPWGILRIATVEMHDFLSDTTNRGEIIIKNRDTLQFIRNRITHANAIASRLNIDTWIAALLYSHSSDTIDTLALNGYDYLQYNRTIFRDSILAYYLIDLIRSRSPVWDERAKNFIMMENTTLFQNHFGTLFQTDDNGLYIL